MKTSYPDWEVYKRDHCACVYCSFNGMNNWHGWRQLAIDHLIPVSRGGSNLHENKVVSCTRCNILKGSYDPSDGTRPATISAELRKDLIVKVIQYLNIEASEERSDFDLMMDELRSVTVA